MLFGHRLCRVAVVCRCDGVGNRGSSQIRGGRGQVGKTLQVTALDAGAGCLGLSESLGDGGPDGAVPRGLRGGRVVQLSQEFDGFVASLGDLGELDQGCGDQSAEVMVQGAPQPGVLCQELDYLLRGPEDVGRERRGHEQVGEEPAVPVRQVDDGMVAWCDMEREVESEALYGQVDPGRQYWPLVLAKLLWRCQGHWDKVAEQLGQVCNAVS